MRYFYSLFLFAAIISCNSNSGNKTTGDSTTVVTGGVENVNGNIPDTANTTDISGKQPVDSSRVDSSHLDSASKFRK